jgi:hypothetical protein
VITPAAANADPKPTVATARSITSRKIEVKRAYLEAAERDGRSRVAANRSGARECQWVYGSTTIETGGSVPLFDDYCTEALITLRVFLRVGRSVRPGFIKICSYAPHPIKTSSKRPRSPRSPAPCHASGIATRLAVLAPESLLVTGG